MKRGLVLVGCAAAVALGAASSQAAQPDFIVFSADRLPSVSGEIYLVHPNGRRVDLSRSPSQDVAPTVSWDGKKVAFVSDRTPKGAVYEVGIDGRRLVRVSPRTRVGWDSSTALAWQPHGERLALDANDELWILRHGRKPVKVSGRGDEFAARPWSPDGRVLLAEEEYGAEVTAITPQGRKIWNVVDGSVPTWSSQGLVALKIQDGGSAGSLAVYDEKGHALFRIRFASGFPSPSWSPDGSRLAILSGGNLQLRSATGALLERKRVAQNSQIAWAGRHRLLVVHDFRSRWLQPRSGDGRYAAITQKSGTGFKLGVGPAAGGAARTYADVPGCWNDGVWWTTVDHVQFAGDSRSLVYMKACYEPFANLYSVAPDGSGVHEIGAIAPYATQPAISPDGTRMAYSWAQFTGVSCKGCASEIRLANTDGAGSHILTNPTQDCTFDNSPVWSPDGQTILFSEGTCSNPAELYTVPAAGGTPHDLGVVGTDPAWGPSRIAYEDGGIWTANPNGSDPVEVAKSGDQPAWSADGRLAYRINQFGDRVVVGSTQVTLPFASVTSLAWSPDGTRFVVTARKTSTAPPDVYTVRTNGTDPIQLTKNYDASGASWR
jgi:Tol biopolymer transport system component